ncbi:MAG: hypothetical protein ACYCQI_06205 [Gammaproteobacteria bacterium]
MFSAASNAVGYWLGWGQENKSQEPKPSNKQDSTVDTDASWEVIEHEALTTALDNSPKKQDTVLENKVAPVTEVILDKEPEALEIPEETITSQNEIPQNPLSPKTSESPTILPTNQKIEVVTDGPITEYQPPIEDKEIQRTTSAQLLDKFAEIKIASTEIDSPRIKTPSPRHESPKPEPKCAKTHPVIINPQPDSPRELDDTFTSCTGAFTAIKEYINEFFAGFFKPQPDIAEAPKQMSASKRMVSI